MVGWDIHKWFQPRQAAATKHNVKLLRSICMFFLSPPHFVCSGNYRQDHPNGSYSESGGYGGGMGGGENRGRGRGGFDRGMMRGGMRGGMSRGGMG